MIYTYYYLLQSNIDGDAHGDNKYLVKISTNNGDEVIIRYIL